MNVFFAGRWVIYLTASLFYVGIALICVSMPVFFTKHVVETGVHVQNR
jgi:hypothetical protein